MTGLVNDFLDIIPKLQAIKYQSIIVHKKLTHLCFKGHQ